MKSSPGRRARARIQSLSKFETRDPLERRGFGRCRNFRGHSCGNKLGRSPIPFTKQIVKQKPAATSVSLVVTPAEFEPADPAPPAHRPRPNVISGTAGAPV